MKKLFKYFTLVSICAATLWACQKEELETDQFGQGVKFAAMAPNPVMRGGELRIIGSNLDKVTEVRFAGDVTVTDINVVTSGAHAEIRVTVPLEGPLVGPVTVVANDGKTFNSFADLTFTEPIEIDSYTPSTVLSGDVLTFKGEYLNDVHEVIFTGNAAAVATEFVSQSRHELKVVVPSSAISGPVILSDVNELEDENTIPNHIYTKTDLVVGDPTVVKAAKAVYKSGDVITVTGEHLDMIETVELPQVGSVEFAVAADGKSITCNLPPKAGDGNITLTSFGGVTFDAGEIETVNVAELAVASLAQDKRFKAGADVSITGSNLDLVSGVSFENAEATWYKDGDKIVATIPAAAKDGPVTVSLESGKKAYSADIEVVKPVILAWEHFDSVVAGETVVTIEGNDMDLVESAKIGNKDEGFIDCEFTFKTNDLGFIDVLVAIPEQAYSGPIILTSAAGYETSTFDFVVTYNMAVSIDFDQDAYGLGNNITISGKNLMQIDQIYIKGKRVVNYVKRADDAMAFAIPDGIGPGVYRLALTLMDGSEITWPVPFSITAPFTETFYWEGNEDLGSWSNQPYLGADGALAGKVEVGDVIRIYYTPKAEWWQFEIFDGHWGGMSFPELDGGKAVTAKNTDPDAKFFAFEVTDANIGALTSVGGWGGILVVQGENVVITGLSVIHFGAAEQRTTIWEGSQTVGNWDGSLGALSWGGYDWSTVEAGTKLAVSFTTSSDDAVMRFGNGNWASLPSLAGLATDGNIPIAGLTSYEFELTDADLKELTTNGGLVICGAFWTLTEVALVTLEGAGPVGNTIWEGSHEVNWGGTDEAHKALTTLSWGGYDWSTVAEGTTLVLEFERTADEVQIRLGNGSWAALPGTEDPYKPEGSSLEVELTAAMIAEMVANGGLVITGQGYTLTAVILK